MITVYFKPKPKPALPPPPKPRGRPRKQKTTASPEDQPPAKKAKKASAMKSCPSRIVLITVIWILKLQWMKLLIII